jgi:hypothetical protein
MRVCVFVAKIKEKWKEEEEGEQAKCLNKTLKVFFSYSQRYQITNSACLIIIYLGDETFLFNSQSLHFVLFALEFHTHKLRVSMEWKKTTLAIDL